MSQLTLIATPIGNLQDMTPRALEALKAVDVIACEDTRRTQQLLAHFGITGKRLLAHHQANEHRSTQGLIQLLQQGQAMAYVSDGGMPTVSDPGFLLCQAAHAANIHVVAIPGASALTTALAVSGIPAARFIFLGFMPRKKGDQIKLLTSVKELPMALVVYESPQRLLATVEMLIEHCGAERLATCCRELTKMHEEVLRLPLGELHQNLATRKEIKGECTLVIAPAA